MSEGNIIKNTKIPNTVESIKKDLIQCGIDRGDILMVHSSLSNIGWVCGGPQAVILALHSVVGEEGTIVMPAQSGDWSDPIDWQNPPVPEDWIEIIHENLPAFDVNLTPTRGMGKIAELFRTIPNTYRSNHPQVSFCANGKYSKEITKCHSLTPEFGMETPLGKLYSLDAKILLLGVDYESCTSFHLAEILTRKLPRKKMGTAIFENVKRVWKQYEDYDYNSDDFNLIGKALEEAGYVTQGKVGNALCRVFNMKDSVDFAYKWLLENRFKNNE